MLSTTQTQKPRTFDDSVKAGVAQLVRHEVVDGQDNASVKNLYRALMATKDFRRETFCYALTLEPRLMPSSLVEIMKQSLKEMNDPRAPFPHLSEHFAAASFTALATSKNPKIRPMAAMIYEMPVEALQKMPDSKQKGSIELYQLAYLTKVLDRAMMNRLGNPLEQEDFTAKLLRIAGARNRTGQSGHSTGIFALLAERCLDRNYTTGVPPLNLISWCLKNSDRLSPEALKIADHLIAVGLGNHNSRSEVIDLLVAQAKPTRQDCIGEQIAATHLARDIVSDYDYNETLTVTETQTRAANLMRTLTSSRVSKALITTLKTLKDLPEDTFRKKEAKAHAFFAIHQTAIELQRAEETKITAETKELGWIAEYLEDVIGPRPAHLMREKAWEYLTDKNNGLGRFLNSLILDAAIRNTSTPSTQDLLEVARGLEALSQMGETRYLNQLLDKENIQHAISAFLQLADEKRQPLGKNPLDHYVALIRGWKAKS